MQHKKRQELLRDAAVHGRPGLTRNQRLRRWAELLERTPNSLLGTLPGTEYHTGYVRDSMRAEHSALSVALADPVLRAEGLANDTYGEAKRFFVLTDRQLHDIVCHCHQVEAAGATSVAKHVRAAAGPGKVPEALSGFVIYGLATSSYGGLIYFFAVYLLAR
jgi:hypothetical protein